ncbi:hypothetical protein [Paenibacillus jamilae]|uniref:hypothetical protein n=1 Tax=Paenibacillus jamilae TaxID=114136 RepID=UPI00128F8EAB|nr:hypothetical protein [Paenibacillus jamilae]
MAMRYLRSPPLPVYRRASASIALAVHPCRIASPSVKRSWSERHTERRNANSLRLPAAISAVISLDFRLVVVSALGLFGLAASGSDGRRCRGSEQS